MAVELTARELALANGDNPDDAASPEPVVSTSAAPAAETQAAAAAETGENPSADSGSGGGTDAAASSASWLKDQHRELGKSYGFSDDELGEFQSEAEFNRATRAIDKQLATFGQAARQQNADPAATAAQQTQRTAPATQIQDATAPPAPAQSAATQAAINKLSRVDVEKLKANGYDDDAIAELSKLNSVAEVVERIEGRFQQIEQQFNGWQQYQMQAAQRQQLYDFHAAIDALNDDRFGKAFDSEGREMQLTNEQIALRDRVGHAAYDIASGHASRGAPVPPMNILAQRARNYAFAEEIRAEERKKVQADISDQSKKRRPVAQQARNPLGRHLPPARNETVPRSINEEAREFFKSPDIQAAYNRLPSVGAA